MLLIFNSPTLHSYKNQLCSREKLNSTGIRGKVVSLKNTDLLIYTYQWGDRHERVWG